VTLATRASVAKRQALTLALANMAQGFVELLSAPHVVTRGFGRIGFASMLRVGFGVTDKRFNARRDHFDNLIRIIDCLASHRFVLLLPVPTVRFGETLSIRFRPFWRFIFVVVC
jgi:hypothetical protein